MLTEFRTTALPTVDRFDCRHDMTTSALVPNALRSEHEKDFRAGAQLLDFGTVQVSALSYPPLETFRTTRPIRRADPECYQVMVNLRGGHRIVQGGKDITGGPGDLLCYDTSRPWRGWAGEHPLAVEGVMAQVPRALPALPANRVDRLLPLRVPATSGMAALFSCYLRQLVAGAAAYREADGTHLANATVELLTALLLHHLHHLDDAGTTAPDGTHRHALLLQIKAFVRRHLGEPRLDPAAIAAAHHLSVRSLHRLFGEQGTTVAGWIRARRLEHCHRDLADPLLRDVPIHAISTRWGLADPAHFSRVFRAAYGTSPSEYRRLALLGHGRRTSSTAGR
ncbi:helix-turn-helix domain-containing protein [Streptomyces formicae]|uniref:Helix-turn-helix domain-containing protein n=1 Tax=Streptomyces formicae TaxID=1616117 RepID=A0ABY3WQG8_9ACTN|nr:helix-turn-helix domain-containing protein [Streptomyces formicae]UNM14867.1 helix-turn-helix domain-containing protein [Streptomyces formicae]